MDNNDIKFRLMQMNLLEGEQKASVKSHAIEEPKIYDIQDNTPRIEKIVMTPVEISLGQVNARKYRREYDHFHDDRKDFWDLDTDYVEGELFLTTIGEKEIYTFKKYETTYKVNLNIRREDDMRPSLGSHHILLNGEKWFLDIL